MVLKLMDAQGNWINDDSQIRLTFIRYFKALYSPPSLQPKNDVNLFFQSLGPITDPFIKADDHGNIMKPPAEKEVKEILFQMGPDKSPGLDGMSARFLQEH